MTNKAVLLLRSGAVVTGEIVDPAQSPDAKAYADDYRQVTGRTGKMLVFRSATVQVGERTFRVDNSLTGCFVEDIDMDLGDVQE